MPFETYLDSFVTGAKVFIRRKSGRHRSRDKEQHYSGGIANGDYHKTYLESDHHATGFFNNAQNLVFNNAVMNEITNNMIFTGKTVLEILHPHTMPDAAVDSSARDPPPRCHPGTRIRIMNRLVEWLDDSDRDWEMLWLYGPAGSGKSAIAQTFAELCVERKRLGAAYFFSRPNRRSKPETLIPTLAYQLAFHCQEYHSIISQALSNDPQLLHKTFRVQFSRLIIDPFTQLREQGHESIKKPFVVILDGLDECDGERVQGDFIKMIGEHTRSRRRFPILWLICSRPEPHITHIFSRLPECIREKLLMDRECQNDVERFVRDEFASINDEYRYIIPSSWPSEEQVNELLQFFSALFVAASVGLKYVGDPTAGNPVKRLRHLISFVKRAEGPEAGNPFNALDMLYTHVLAEIPVDVLPTTMQVLSFLVTITALPLSGDWLLSAQVLCNVLRLEQNAYYAALRKLHSIAYIPPPVDALENRITFYHASFEDFLIDFNRSGKFWINKRNALVEFTSIVFSWHQLDATLFHSRSGIEFKHDHKHGCLPDLSWASAHDQEQITVAISDFAFLCTSFAFVELRGEGIKHDTILAQVLGADFRCMDQSVAVVIKHWLAFQDPCSTMIRTEPSNDDENLLLQYLEILLGGDPTVNLVTRALQSFSQTDSRSIEYFFFGESTRTLLVVIVGHTNDHRSRFLNFRLNADAPPSQDDIDMFKKSLKYLSSSV